MAVIEDIELFERVCDVIWSAGFEVAGSRPTGVQIGLRPHGVLVGWRTEDDPAGAGTHGEAAAGTGPAMSRLAVTRALAAILREAGCQVVPDGEDLLVTGAPGEHAGGSGRQGST